MTIRKHLKTTNISTMTWIIQRRLFLCNAIAIERFQFQFPKNWKRDRIVVDYINFTFRFSFMCQIKICKALERTGKLWAVTEKRFKNKHDRELSLFRSRCFVNLGPWISVFSNGYWLIFETQKKTRISLFADASNDHQQRWVKKFFQIMSFITEWWKSICKNFLDPSRNVFQIKTASFARPFKLQSSYWDVYH